MPGITFKFTSARNAVASFAAIVFVGSAAAAYAYTGEEFARDAKISMGNARAIAMHAHSGRITDEELENEPGGSGLRYSFDIQDGGATYEVGVDARDGTVLENAAEGKHPD